MQPVSVVIITFNEESNIGRCIDSVREVADEILILDSYSTDSTLNIAQSKGAVVHQQKFLGYGPQKNKGLELCKYDLVLSLDADEALDNNLVRAILREKENPSHSAYSMNRCTNYCGRFIRHGSWYPDKKIRFFDRKLARWSDGMIHEKVEVSSGTDVKHLPGDILHYSFNSIEDHVSQNNKFSSISAETLFLSGRKTNLFKLLVNPTWAFFRSYILRAGFVDGLAGLIIARNISHLTFLKHSKLLLLQRRKRPK